KKTPSISIRSANKKRPSIVHPRQLGRRECGGPLGNSLNGAWILVAEAVVTPAWLRRPGRCGLRAAGPPPRPSPRHLSAVVAAQLPAPDAPQPDVEPLNGVQFRRLGVAGEPHRDIRLGRTAPVAPIPLDHLLPYRLLPVGGRPADELAPLTGGTNPAC